MSTGRHPTPPLLAVDGGNTKTEAAVIDPSGRVWGKARGGPSDIYGSRHAVATLQNVVEQALTQAGTDIDHVAHAAFRLAGVDWDEDLDLWHAAINHQWPGLSYSVKNDGHIFDHVAHPDGHGISVVLGTGAAVGGSGPAGDFALSWWIQHPLGASGLVWEALRAAALFELGLAPATALTYLLPRLMEQDDIAGCLHAVHRRDSSWDHARLASLAPALTDLGQRDAVVSDLLANQAHSLVGYVQAVQARCQLTQHPPIAIGGGMITGAPGFGELVRQTLLGSYPASTVVLVEGSALYGVASSALCEAGWAPSRCAADALLVGLR